MSNRYLSSTIKSITVDEENQDYKSIDGVLFSKDGTELIAYPKNREGESYTIPSTVTTIGTYAFAYNRNLTSLVIPDSVTSIKGSAFEYCSNLTSLTMPITASISDTSSFSEVKNLKSIILTKGTEEVHNHLYSGTNQPGYYGSSPWYKSASKLESLTIADGVKHIGAYTFYSFSPSNSIELTIPDSVESIGSYAFASCSNNISLNLINNESIKVFEFGGKYYSVFDIDFESNQINKICVDLGGSIADASAFDTLNQSINTGTFIIQWNSLQDISVLNPIEVSISSDYVIENELYLNKHKTILSNAFYNSNISSIQYYESETSFSLIDIKNGNDQLINNIVFEKHALIPVNIGDTIVYLCSGCHKIFLDSTGTQLAQIPIEDLDIQIEYTQSFYEGTPLHPSVSVKLGYYQLFENSNFLLEYKNNNKPGTASIVVTGINGVKGSRSFKFEISLKNPPRKIEEFEIIEGIEKCTLKWKVLEENTTLGYRIYRRATEEESFSLLATIKNTNITQYDDENLIPDTLYYYYIVGIEQFGFEGEEYDILNATPKRDDVKPVIESIDPSPLSAISKKLNMTVKANDNFEVDSISFYYSIDSGENWNLIKKSEGDVCSVVLDVSQFNVNTIKIKVQAEDIRSNLSDPVVAVYIVDNEKPEKVANLIGEATSSTVKLSWDEVGAIDIDGYNVLAAEGENWAVIAEGITSTSYEVDNLNGNALYKFKVGARDIHGNIGEYSDVLEISTLSDNSAPRIVSFSPLAKKTNTNINYSSTVIDDTGISKIIVQISTDLEHWSKLKSFDFSESKRERSIETEIDISSYQDGSIYVRTIAEDYFGNSSLSNEYTPFVEYLISRTNTSDPNDFDLISGNGYVEISFGDGGGLHSIYKSDTYEGEYEPLVEKTDSPNYRDRDVVQDVVFYYKVISYDDAGNASDLSEVKACRSYQDTEKPIIVNIESTFNNTVSDEYNTISIAAFDNHELKKIVVEYATDHSFNYSTLVEKEVVNEYYTEFNVDLPTKDCAQNEKIYIRVYAIDQQNYRSDFAYNEYIVDKVGPEIQEFNITVNSNRVLLSWKGLNEEDIAGYLVYSSTSGKDFKKIGSRAGGKIDYAFTDIKNSVTNATLYYKIEAIDVYGNRTEFIESIDYSYSYANIKPVAILNGPITIPVGGEVEFDGTASYDDIGINTYQWEFGDGTTSSLPKPKKSFAEIGTYSVTLTVTDEESNSSTAQHTVYVREYDSFGMLKVIVVDEQNRPVSKVPVYFDLGNDDQQIQLTNSSGSTQIALQEGTHLIGTFSSDYLPVKENIVIEANSEKQVVLRTKKQKVISGNFETKRLTYEEIIEAGIDVDATENRNVYEVNFELNYTTNEDIGLTVPTSTISSGGSGSSHGSGSSASSSGTGGYRGSVVGNGNYTISAITTGNSSATKWKIKDSNGNVVPSFTDSNGEKRQISDIQVIVPKGWNYGQIIAILDVPVKASTLKEFFDVRLHLINNAAEEFSLVDNTVKLNIPEGVTVMNAQNNAGQSISPLYETNNEIHFDELKGQDSITLTWLVRGDKTGSYYLDADYEGLLSVFNEPVSAKFKMDEPINIYGLDGLKINFVVNEELLYNTLYFDVELENVTDTDIYLPKLDICEKIRNVFEIKKWQEKTEYVAFEENASVLNVYLVNSDGTKKCIPFTIEYLNSSNADSHETIPKDVVTEGVNKLAPGQKLLYECAAYGITSFDDLILMDVIPRVFSGNESNINVIVKNKDGYSYYSNLTDLVSRMISNSDVSNVLDYMYYDDNFYYPSINADLVNELYYSLSNAEKIILDGDFKELYQDDSNKLIEKILLDYLVSDEIQKTVDEYSENEIIKFVNDYLLKIKISASNDDNYNYLSDYISLDDVSLIDDLVYTCKTKDLEAVSEKMVEILKNKGLSITNIELNRLIDTNDLISEKFAKEFSLGQSLVGSGIKAIKAYGKQIRLYDILRKCEQYDVAINYLQSIESATNNQILRNVVSGMINAILSEKSDVSWCMETLGQISVGADAVISESASFGFKQLTKIVKKSIPYESEISVAFDVLDFLMQYKQFDTYKDMMDVYRELDGIFSTSLKEQLKHRNSVFGTISSSELSSLSDSDINELMTEDKSIILTARSLFDTRLKGEQQLKKLFNMQLYGKLAGPSSNESDILRKINRVKGEDYTAYKRWSSEVTSSILKKRDLVFNENSSYADEPVIPKAPEVILNYKTMKTADSYSDEYEYCFGNGEWIQCNGEEIPFTITTVPSVLRVRIRANGENVSGYITTVEIPASKQINGDLTVKYNGESYIIDNLDRNYQYEVCFVDDANNVDWNEMLSISSECNEVKAVGDAIKKFAAVRIAGRSTDYYVSEPVFVEIIQKQDLNISITGRGGIEINNSGRYYIGENIDLVAKPKGQSKFIGWFINNELVSENNHYMTQMTDGLCIEARFTGTNMIDLVIDKLPDKTDYYENETIDLSGLVVKGVYEDGSLEIIDDYLYAQNIDDDGNAVVSIKYGNISKEFGISISHKEDEWHTIETESMFGYGKMVRKCSVCGKVLETKTIPTLDNQSSFEIDVENRYILHIPDSLSVAYIENYFASLGQKVKVIKQNGQNGTIIGTSGEAVCDGIKYTIVIYGDVDGNGEVDIFDIFDMINHINEDYVLEGANKKAGILYGGDDIGIFDLYGVIDYVNGEGDILSNN